MNDHEGKDFTHKEKFLEKLHGLSVLNEPVDYYRASCIDPGECF